MVEANYQTFSGDVDITSNLSADTNTFFVDSVTNRVGIGNTTPSTSLDVLGEVKISNDLKINTDTFVVDVSEGRVSINKTTPDYTLDVGGDINLDSTNHVIRSGGSSVIRFNSEFNVGIGGAASDTNKLKVSGNIEGTNLVATNLKLNNGGHIFHNNQNVIRFSADRVGIGGEADGAYRVKINGDIKASNFRGALVGNASTTTALETSRNIGGVSFNGTANIDLPGVNTAGNQNTSGSSTSCNGNADTSSNTSGSSTSCNGNAATATELQTARDIGGVSFDGSASINLPGVNTAGDQDTTGNAATSTNTTGSSTSCNGNAETSTNTNGSSTSCNGNAATSTNCANAANTNGSSSTNFSCYALTASNNVTAYSDRRLKENIKPIENALDKVCQIGGYTFTRNDLEDSKKRHAGIIAQELMEVLPEVVEGTEETKYSVAYGNIIALLIEAIKELKYDVDQLK